jgi:hypothetical protein
MARVVTETAHLVAAEKHSKMAQIWAIGSFALLSGVTQIRRYIQNGLTDSRCIDDNSVTHGRVDLRLAEEKYCIQFDCSGPAIDLEVEANL